MPISCSNIDRLPYVRWPKHLLLLLLVFSWTENLSVSLFHCFNEAIYLSVNHILFIYFSWMKISSQWRWLAMRLGTCQKATPWTCLKTLFQCVFFPSQIKVRIMIHMIHVLKFIHIPYWEFYVLFLFVHSSLLLFLLYFSDACCIKRFGVGVIDSIWKKIRNVKLWNGNVLGAACIG